MVKYIWFFIFCILSFGCHSIDPVSVQPTPNGGIISFSPKTGKRASAVTIYLQNLPRTDTLGQRHVFWSNQELTFKVIDSSTIVAYMPGQPIGRVDFFEIRYFGKDTVSFKSAEQFQVVVDYNDTAQMIVRLTDIGVIRRNRSINATFVEEDDTTTTTFTENFGLIDPYAGKDSAHNGLLAEHIKKGFNTIGYRYSSGTETEHSETITILSFKVDSIRKLVLDVTFQAKTSYSSYSAWHGGNGGSDKSTEISFTIPSVDYIDNVDGSKEILLSGQAIAVTGNSIKNNYSFSSGGAAVGRSTSNTTLSNEFYSSSRIYIHIPKLVK